MNIPKHDEEGRLLTLVFTSFILVSCYTPNAGEGLKRLEYRTKEWDVDFIKYIKGLRNKNNKPVVLCGDLNVAP